MWHWRASRQALFAASGVIFVGWGARDVRWRRRDVLRAQRRASTDERDELFHHGARCPYYLKDATYYIYPELD